MTSHYTGNPQRNKSELRHFIGVNVIFSVPDGVGCGPRRSRT